MLIAYIDPSAGGMLVQLLLAGTAGVAVLGKLFWHRIRTIVGLPPPADTASAESGGGASAPHQAQETPASADHDRV